MVEVEQDPEDKTEWEGYADPFTRDLPEPHDPIPCVLSLERHGVGGQRDVWLVHKATIVSLVELSSPRMDGTDGLNRPQ